jgi:hypothetical protein
MKITTIIKLSLVISIVCIGCYFLSPAGQAQIGHMIQIISDKVSQKLNFDTSLNTLNSLLGK